MEIKTFESANKVLLDSPSGYTLSLISSKWKISILSLIYEYQPIRFNALYKIVGGITYKALSVALKEMESDGLVERKEFPQIPPKVEYRLSDKGQSLMPVIHHMYQWGREHEPNAYEA